MDNKTETAWKIFENQQNLIKFFDSKINILLIISSIATSVILTNLKDLILLGLLSKILVILFFCLFLVFIIFALLTIFPRKATKTGSSLPKLIYFKDISERVEPNDYVNDFIGTNENDLQKDIYYQIYEIATILNKKSKNYNTSWICLLFQSIFFIILLLLKAF